MLCAAARRTCRAVSGCRCRYPKATGLRLGSTGRPAYRQAAGGAGAWAHRLGGEPVCGVNDAASCQPGLAGLAHKPARRRPVAPDRCRALPCGAHRGSGGGPARPAGGSRPARIILLGYSLGGNLVLKFMGEGGHGVPVLAAIAVSAPDRSGGGLRPDDRPPQLRLSALHAQCDETRGPGAGRRSQRRRASRHRRCPDHL